MKYALNEAVKQGFNAAFLIGSPLYYKRFDFNETNSYNIKISAKFQINLCWHVNLYLKLLKILMLKLK